MSVRAGETDIGSPTAGRNRHSRTGRRLGALLLGLALAPGLTACGENYCDTVEDHQSELSEVTASGSPAALLAALPIFRDLFDQAPDDIRDDWKALLDPLEELDEALRDAGIDPAAYDRDGLPHDLSHDDRTRIGAAGAALADPAVVRAFDNVQQQAKDVCHTPLSL